MLMSPDGHIIYSGIETTSFETSKGFRMLSVNQDNCRVSFMVDIEKSGNYSFSIYNMNGSPAAIKQIQLVTGTQATQIDNNPLKSGIYILPGEYADQRISTKNIGAVKTLSSSINYTSIRNGSSSRPFSVCRKAAPVAPSTTR